jgi:hypothetical protein
MAGFLSPALVGLDVSSSCRAILLLTSGSPPLIKGLEPTDRQPISELGVHLLTTRTTAVF